MMPIRRFLSVFMLLLVLRTASGKRRHRHHTRISAETEVNTGSSENNEAANVAYNEEQQSNSPNTPADTNGGATQYYLPKQYSNSPSLVAAAPSITQYAATVEKNESEKKEKDSVYRWGNHSIPFLKRFRKEIDGGKIKHHNYEEMTWFMKYFAEEYPDITRLYSIGRSVQNRKLWVLEISDHPGEHEPGEPEMKYIGNIHGNEVVGKEILLQLIKYLCEHYEDVDDVRNLVDGTRIHIFPAMNPDGYELAATHKKSNNPDITEDVIGRLNANGVDLNRNFPDQFFETNLDTFEPESEAVMSWIKKYPFALSASFHSGALVVTYPFDDSPSGQTQYSATPDDDLFRQLSKSYSESHPKMHLANPHEINCTRSMKKFTDGISNGAAWSPLTGGMQDFNYVKSNCYEVTVELGCEKFPHEENLKLYWNENKKSLLKYIEFANRGVRGFVKDRSGNPIKGARISVGDRKHDIRSAVDGDYWRMLVPGTYDIECHAKGFKRKIVNVDIPVIGHIVVNFTMVPKQIDELEEALGHVNKATLLSHDLMYRFDGRDSGNAAPKEVIQKVEAQRTGREGTTYEQDTMARSDQSIGSGSGADETSQAIHLAENLALNPIVEGSESNRAPLTPSHSLPIESTYLRKVEKYNKVTFPDIFKRDTLLSAIGPKLAKNDTEEGVEEGRSVSNKRKTIEIDEHVSKRVEEDYGMKPTIGMYMGCKVPGKEKRMTGTLQYLGTIDNLPKKSDVIVAGLKLDEDEDLGSDGTFLGKQYFFAAPNRGYFVPIKDCAPA